MSKKEINRRDFLKFLSSTSALSLLGTSLPIYRSYAQSSAAPMRLLFIPKYYGWVTRDGIADEIVTMDSNSTLGFRFTDVFSALEPFKEHVTVIENLRGVHWGNAHDISYANILTNACIEGETNSAQLQFNEPLGPSLDWMLGQRLNKEVLRLDLGIGRGAPLCFDDKSTRQPMLTHLESVYDEVIKPILRFQEGGNSNDLQLRAINNEMFDLLGRSTDLLEKMLQGSSHEQRKIASFKSSLSLSNPNKSIITSTLANVNDPSRLLNKDLDILERLEHAGKLIKAAFMADTKRIAVLSTSGQASLDQIHWTDKDGNPQVGMTKVNEDWMALGNAPAATNFHHLVSHYNRVDPTTNVRYIDENARRCMDANNKLFVDKIAKIVEDLSITLDIDGKPMIENTCIALTSEITTGTHDVLRMPMVLIGGRGAGGLNTGRVIRGELTNTYNNPLKTETRDGKIVNSNLRRDNVSLSTQGDVFVSLAKAMGVNINSFGLATRNSQRIIL